MHMERAYQEVIEFIAGGTTPKSVIEFRPSQASVMRIEMLIQLKKTAELSAAENSELEHYMELEHMMRMAKARARHYLTT